MKKILVAYFSCTGTTERAAKAVAAAVGADIFEIVPQKAYTAADLDWTDKKSRSSVEMSDESCRPAIKSRVEGMDEYETVFLGFPIWWYVAPRIINTFLESYNFSGKNILIFATSGGSGMGRTLEHLKASCPDGVVWGKPEMLNGSLDEKKIILWAQKYI